MSRSFKDALLNHNLTLGTWLQVGHPACAEILAHAGFDWLCVDLEHGDVDLESATVLFRTLSAFDCTAMARLPANDPIWIHRILDAGAQGLIVPMVTTAAQAEEAVRQAKYPPRGVRGFGYSRANRYGERFDDYVSSANDDITMVMQIEHVDAIANLEEIIAVDGVDALFIGPYDLSGSMNVPGQMDHPDVRAALDTYYETCSRLGMVAGAHIVRPTRQNVQEAVDRGCTFVALGVDTVFLHQAATLALDCVGD